ncbi:site-specific integrase [Clostridium sp. AF37-5]|uniref:site-specific integrase n=1 Tax=Clostridium sp. AF37-5 TaxID=2293016 RepID=UPI000E4D43B9|nr:site-specific integrase [Clostridium sp. AF37-5]RHO99336.1 site-specific integrase [Clostridium sp. AF37-5]
MTNIDIPKSEILQYAIDNDMIDSVFIQEQIKMQRNEELLSKHPYKIWKGKDGKWYSYFPDKEKGRVLRKRNTEELIKDEIIAYWKKQESNPTISDIYSEWINGKVQREEITKATRDRYNRQYEQCFLDFGKHKIKSISEYDIEEFVLDAIYNCKLTQKGFSNLRTLILGIFKLARRKRLVSFSISELMNDMDISKKLFRRNVKSDDEQVFTTDELPKVLDYLKENPDIVNLGIFLLFKTGLRIGELAALKKTDITQNVIHISKTEIHYNDDAGNIVYEVRDSPKTEAGIRDVVVPDSGIRILNRIRLLNPFGEYLFERRGKRIRTYVFRERLRNICRKLDITMKSPHKIRKTYGSILIDNNVQESLVINQMGHTDIKTTKKHYYRNRMNYTEKKNIINHVADL